MAYQVYIIYSPKLDSFYVGYTESLTDRIKQHNNVLYDGAYTSKTDDWELFHTIECASKRQAILIESHIKRMRSRKYYFSLRDYPEVSLKLLSRYN